VYFSDEEEVERAFTEAAPERRPDLALKGFGYWHYGILLGIVAVAAGLKKAIGDPYEPLDAWISAALSVGTALFIASEVGFRRTFGVARNRIRLVTAAVVLATVPLGTELGAAAQVGAIAALVAAGLAAEWRVDRGATVTG
jgi:low temperature requirement protein LtrA